MAKKRRDDGRDSSTVKRVLKAGGAVLAVGAGATLFARSGLLEKSNKLIPALLDTSKAYTKEMYGKKRTAMNMYEAFNKTVGKKGEVFKDVLAGKELRVKGYRPSTGRRTNLTGITKNIRQTSRSKLVKEFNRELSKQAQSGALKSILGDKKFEKYNQEALERIVKETAAKYKEISNETGEVSTDFLKRVIEMYQVDEKDAYEIISRTSVSMRRTMKSSVNQSHLKKITESIEKERLEGLRNKRTRDNEFINKIGKRFGIEHLDDKLLKSHKVTLGELLANDGENLKKLEINDDDFAEQIKNRIKLKGHENDHLINSIRDIKKLYKEGELTDDIIFDDYLRARTNADGSLEFIDMTETMEYFNQKKKKFDSSLLGRVLTKGIDRQGMKNAPDAFMLHSGMKSTISYLDRTADDLV